MIKSRRLRWAGHITRMEEDRGAFKMLTEKSTGKRPLGVLGKNDRTVLEELSRRFREKKRPNVLKSVHHVVS